MKVARSQDWLRYHECDGQRYVITVQPVRSGSFGLLLWPRGMLDPRWTVTNRMSFVPGAAQPVSLVLDLTERFPSNTRELEWAVVRLLSPEEEVRCSFAMEDLRTVAKGLLQLGGAGALEAGGPEAVLPTLEGSDDLALDLENEGNAAPADHRELALRFLPYFKFSVEQKARVDDDDAKSLTAVAGGGAGALGLATDTGLIVAATGGVVLVADLIWEIIDWAEGDVHEAYRPCSWQWQYSHATLRTGDVDQEIGQTFRDFARVLDYSDLRRPSGGKQDDVVVRIHDDAQHGETWEDVKKGHGFYCHCSEIDDDLVNLEYWVLFGFNKPSVLAHWMAHKSDLICVQMVYCRTQDRIVRVAFNIHGCCIVAFDLTGQEHVEHFDMARDFAGVDIDNQATSTMVEKVWIADDRQYQHGKVEVGPITVPLSPCDPVIYFAQDPMSGAFEHLVVFNEWGTHEPWPNPSGSMLAIPTHNGKGYSFLPEAVTLLDPCFDEPFLYFGGHLGDPAAVMRHRAWYPDDPDVQVPDDRKADDELYKQLGNLSWPPMGF